MTHLPTISHLYGLNGVPILEVVTLNVTYTQMFIFHPKTYPQIAASTC